MCSPLLRERGSLVSFPMHGRVLRFDSKTYLLANLARGGGDFGLGRLYSTTSATCVIHTHERVVHIITPIARRRLPTKKIGTANKHRTYWVVVGEISSEDLAGREPAVPIVVRGGGWTDRRGELEFLRSKCPLLSQLRTIYHIAMIWLLPRSRYRVLFVHVSSGQIMPLLHFVLYQRMRERYQI